MTSGQPAPGSGSTPPVGESKKPGTGGPAAPAVRASRADPGRWVRFLDVLAGLLSAGVLVVGIITLLAAVIAPAAVAAAGLGVANGPGWGRVVAQLSVGVVGELVVLLRRRWPTGVRVLADTVVVLAALLVLWWAWLP